MRIGLARLLRLVLGNVIGGGDWARDRLVPDVGASDLQLVSPFGFDIPGATRPWQHVLEPLCGYLTLAQRLGSEAGASYG